MNKGKAVAREKTVQINKITLWLNKQQKLVEKYNKYIYNKRKLIEKIYLKYSLGKTTKNKICLNKCIVIIQSN